ncbi:hypothetical protein [Pseudofrankia sp. BMG5.36]|uniref:hypothetical protein n=1 Tax=Pseudofrankia sp. BMG5.36 TaxID=1834512 RepID=UPI0008D94F31|nr:hypothetical protein [Pseudofrankia sp. BMG5.36]OHV61405.1 hypothetical protein BCD48_39765 [Pseudofrankia sp. BMG5.36]
MPMVMIEIDGSETGPVAVAWEPCRLPKGSGVLLGCWPWPRFVPVGPYKAETVAQSLAGRDGVSVLVACPAGVSPGHSTLALEVARLLSDERQTAAGGREPVVTCPIRPRCAWESGGVAVPHLVTVVSRGTARTRVVWEITERKRAVAMLGAGRPVRLVVVS